MSSPESIDTKPQSAESPQWVKVVGISFLGLAVVFMMALIVASAYGKNVDGNGRFLVCALLALVTSIGGGFLGGSAVASGQLPVPRFLENPISFGITGGIATFIIVLSLSSFIYLNFDTKLPPVVPSPTPVVKSPVITDVKTTKGTDGNYIIAVTFQPDPSFSQDKLFIEVATDEKFEQPAKPRFLIDAPEKGGPVVLSIRKSTHVNYWTRLVVDSPDGQIKIKGNAVSFELSES